MTSLKAPPGSSASLRVNVIPRLPLWSASSATRFFSKRETSRTSIVLMSSRSTGQGRFACSVTHASAASPANDSARPPNIASRVDKVSDFPKRRGRDRKYHAPVSTSSVSRAVLST